MRRIYQVTGAALLLCALVIGWQAIRLRYYTALGPGPGFFPLWLCGLLVLLALTIIAQASLQPSAPVPADLLPPRESWPRIAGTVLALFAVALGIATLGFRATMFAFYVVTLPMLGRRNPVETLALAALGSFGVFELFGRILKTPLPTGLLGF
jgi:putative tricarboxylic transport membrane protein